MSMFEDISAKVDRICAERGCIVPTQGLTPDEALYLRTYVDQLFDELTESRAENERLRNTPCFECGHS